MSRRKSEEQMDAGVRNEPPGGDAEQGQLFTKGRSRSAGTPSEPQPPKEEANSPVSPGSSDAEWAGETKAVQDLVKDFRKLAAPLNAVANVRTNDPAVLDKIEEAMKAFPATDLLARAIDDLRSRLKNLVERGRKDRVKVFRKTETEFVQNLRAEGEQVQEAADGWRIGMLELQLRRERAECRFLYNRDVILPWTRVSGPQDLEKARSGSLRRLRGAALDESMLPDLFWETFQACREQGKRTGSAYPDRVSLLEFYQELRLTLVRRELAKKPDRKLAHSEFPRWAFLYNLDLYRKLAPSAPAEKRLALETGNQREGTSIGVVVNGLDPLRNYEVVCYIRQG